MKIFGHRGAAGLAPENTLKSIKAAIKAGVDAIEVDVRLTSDDHFVLSHDISTGRRGSPDMTVSQTTLKDLKAVKLHDGTTIPTLQEAVKTAGSVPLIVEAKGDNWAGVLSKFLKSKPKHSASVIAFNHRELARFRALCPEVPVYALEHWKPFDTIKTAISGQFTGIDMHFWRLNPFTYWLARRTGLEIIVYTVDRLWIAKFLRRLYPHISITTNRPDRLQALRRESNRAVNSSNSMR